MDLSTYLNHLLALPDMYEIPPQVSRDGHWAAWTWLNAGPVANIYAVPTDGCRPPIQLTDSARDSYLVSWTPDSQGIILCQDRDGNERYQLLRVDLAQPGTLLPLTVADPDYFLYGGDLHPDGRWLVYSINYDVATGSEIEPNWIYRHDLINGERLPLARPARPGYTNPKLSPTGEYVLYHRKDLHPGGVQVWLVDIHGQNDREIINCGAAVKTFASWFPDGKRLLVLADTPTHRRLGIYSLSDDRLQWIIDDPGRDLIEAYAPFGSHQVVVLESRKGRNHACLLDPRRSLETTLVSIDGTLLPLAPTAGGRWAGLLYSAQQPADLVRFPLRGGVPGPTASLAHIWALTPLTANDLTPAEDFRWLADDGTPVHGWLYRATPPVRGTIVYVHGGPTWHSEDFLNPQIQFLARAGFNVLDPNYRGSTGYGLPFREAIKQEGWGGAEQHDLLAGIRALIVAGIAQPGKIGMTGTSFGGYSSWYAITHFPPELVKAAAPICGMTDLVVDYETTRPDLRPYSEEMMGGSPQQVPQRYFERSPINFVDQIRGALLIVQGGQDPNVTPQNVAVVEQALHNAGIPYELLTFADEGHGIAKPANQKTLNLRLADFFSRAFEEE